MRKYLYAHVPAPSSTLLRPLVLPLHVRASLKLKKSYSNTVLLHQTQNYKYHFVRDYNIRYREKPTPDLKVEPYLATHGRGLNAVQGCPPPLPRLHVNSSGLKEHNTHSNSIQIRIQNTHVTERGVSQEQYAHFTRGIINKIMEK